MDREATTHSYIWIYTIRRRICSKIFITLCLLKQSEDYPSHALGLRDIRDEITEISSNGISVLGKKFDVHFYLGGDPVVSQIFIENGRT